MKEARGLSGQSSIFSMQLLRSATGQRVMSPAMPAGVRCRYPRLAASAFIDTATRSATRARVNHCDIARGGALGNDPVMLSVGVVSPVAGDGGYNSTSY